MVDPRIASVIHAEARTSLEVSGNSDFDDDGGCFCCCFLGVSLLSFDFSFFKSSITTTYQYLSEHGFHLFLSYI
jgi:hypothetical protein